MDQLYEAIRQNDVDEVRALAADNPEYLQVQREFFTEDGRSVFLTPRQYAMTLRHMYIANLLRDRR